MIDARTLAGLVDLTTLADDDTPERVRTLCERARDPLRDGVARVAAVCVYPRFVETARAALGDAPIPVCTVAGDFPTARAALSARVAEAREARALGADEIDVVIDVRSAKAGAWDALEDEIAAYRQACGGNPMKVILRTGELGRPETIAHASAVAIRAGADFLKTSTGKDGVNATLEAGAVLAGAIRAHHAETGRLVGIKPAGGISTYDQAAAWWRLVERELGEAWLAPAHFRIGASSLLDDLRRVALDRP